MCVCVCVCVCVCFNPFSMVITSLGEEKADLNAFCTFVRFVWFCLFLFLVVSGIVQIIFSLESLDLLWYLKMEFCSCTR